MGVTKKDSVPAELVGRHVRDWVGRFNGTNYEAYDVLALRSGLEESMFAKVHNGTSPYGVRFDTADRMFCAMDMPMVWHCDPDLAERYEAIVREADRMVPLDPLAELEMELAA